VQRHIHTRPGERGDAYAHGALLRRFIARFKHRDDCNLCVPETELHFDKLQPLHASCQYAYNLHSDCLRRHLDRDGTKRGGSRVLWSFGRDLRPNCRPVHFGVWFLFDRF
jgi:hypothetical protein